MTHRNNPPSGVSSAPNCIGCGMAQGLGTGDDENRNDEVTWHSNTKKFHKNIKPYTDFCLSFKSVSTITRRWTYIITMSKNLRQLAAPCSVQTVEFFLNSIWTTSIFQMVLLFVFCHAFLTTWFGWHFKLMDYTTLSRFEYLYKFNFLYFKQIPSAINNILPCHFVCH